MPKIKNVLFDAWYYLYLRFVCKTHILTSNLQKGQYHEYDERILHTLFDSFVDFIECEKAFMHISSIDDISLIDRIKLAFRHIIKYRNASAGLEYLIWETSLTEHDFCELQAESAKWQFDAYNWWKNIRPKRKDPYDFIEDEDYYDKVKELEDKYYAEDSEYLHQLINRRSQLWT